MHVSLAADAAYAVPLAVTLASVALANPVDDVAATVLHDGIPEPLQERILRGPAGRLHVHWQAVDLAAVEGAHYTVGLSPATLFRLLLPDLLPDERRIVHLDSDVLIVDSLRELWETDLEEYAVAAVRDSNSPFPAGPCGTDWRGLGLAAATPYFNAGMLVMHLDAWRAQRLGHRAIDVLRTSGKIARWSDQDALNTVLAGAWKELPRRWNVQSPDLEGRALAWALWPDDVASAIANPGMIHFSERYKPWNPACNHPLMQRWFDVLDTTDWAGWRPGGDLPRRAVARARRAWRVLTAAPAGVTRLR
jgi:lipopolysaccharide biosynthesis glycosyltransferase